MAAEERGPRGSWDTGVTSLCTPELPDAIRRMPFSFYQHTWGLHPVLPQIRLEEFRAVTLDKWLPLVDVVQMEAPVRCLVELVD